MKFPLLVTFFLAALVAAEKLLLSSISAALNVSSLDVGVKATGPYKKTSFQGINATSVLFKASAADVKTEQLQVHNIPSTGVTSPNSDSTFNNEA